MKTNGAALKITPYSLVGKSGAAQGKAKRKPAHARARALSELQIKRVLVPIDFSASCREALVYAARFAKTHGARLTLLHVIEPMPLSDFSTSFPLAVDDEKMSERCRKRMDLLARQERVPVKLVENTLVRLGRSFHEIADTAGTIKADMVIISTHGYTGIKHLFMGSVTERVVQHSPCPVLVVRELARNF